MNKVGNDSTAEIVKEDECVEVNPSCYFKTRHVLAIMGFLGMFNVYSIRSNLSVAIVAMVNSTDSTNDTNSSNPDICPERNDNGEGAATNGEFNWSSTQQGLILGCYFYGYIISNIPGGWLAKTIGIRMVLGVSMLLSSLITLLSPVAANASFELFVAMRILLGFFQGVSFPTMHGAWGKWAPPLERTSLIAIHMSGSSVGTFVTLPLAGVIADNLGWEAVFYFTGGCAFLWSLLWLAIIHNTPQQHPRISEGEKTYIIQSIAEEKKDKDVKVRVPWVAMLTSLPVWAIATAHFASNWGNYTLLTMLPTYMSTILRFNLSASGALSALPYIMQWVVTVCGGYLTDVVRRKTTLSTIFIRKVNTSIGLFVPALFVVLAGYVGCAVAAAVAFFTISVALNAMTVPGCKANPVDIAPKYGGIVYAISNTFANIPGFLAPQVVGLLLQEDDSLTQWRTVFWISAAVYCTGAIIYLVFGTGVEQEWAQGKKTIRKEGIEIKDYDEDGNVTSSKSKL